MLGFVQSWQSWFSPKANPIGIDFGTDTLRLAQLDFEEGEPRLVAAATADVPAYIRDDLAARFEFFVSTTRDLLSQGSFRGRSAVLSLPAARTLVRHVRLAKMDDAALRKTLQWETRDKLPIDPNKAVLRHLVAGEVYQDQEAKREIILMATARDWVERYLAAATKAKLDVVGMNVEPSALVDCFSHVYRRKVDTDATSCFIDLGSSGSRAIIARGQQILFMRALPVGGQELDAAVGKSLSLSMDDARLLRMRLWQAQTLLDDSTIKQEVVAKPPASPQVVEEVPDLRSMFRDVSPAREVKAPAVVPMVLVPKVEADTDPQAKHVSEACREPMERLIQELRLCRRYYEATFPSRPIDRLIFVGGEARNRSLCQYIARSLGLPAQLGDPLVRMGRTSEVGIESGIDRRQTQPGWAVAIGLSAGPNRNGVRPATTAPVEAAPATSPAVQSTTTESSPKSEEVPA